MKFPHIAAMFMLLGVFYFFVSCSNPNTQKFLDHAESIMETHPDSALAKLSGIKPESLSESKQKARHALLLSMAFDKNYIDTTKFDVLQPAIDYYLDKGTPDEKLKTLYYQGRIFQNRGDLDNALNSFIKGIEVSDGATDSLCLARVFIATACLYYTFHDFEGYADNYLKAASIYNSKSFKEDEFESLLHAFNGAVIMEDRSWADSLYIVCNQFLTIPQDYYSLLQECNIAYYSTFKSNVEIKKYIAQLDFSSLSSTDGIIKLALAYHKLNDDKSALRMLEYVNGSGIEFDTLSYQAVAVPVLQGLGHYKEALQMYEALSSKTDSINHWKFDQKSKTLEEKHLMELKARDDARYKSQIIWGCVVALVLLSAGVIILVLIAHNNKVKRDLAYQEVNAQEEKNARLEVEKENLSLENTNLQLEKDNKALEAENLSHRVKSLEKEIVDLKEVLAAQELPEAVRATIKIRVEMLNSLLAGYITDNNQYEKPYDVWVKDLTDNTEEFMNSNRLAFQASHPSFIKYFEEHGLTIPEINYVCLYAIGLIGKEVGNYMKKRSHVNMSSTIRKKLGIDKHETNIGNYVRNLLKKL